MHWNEWRGSPDGRPTLWIKKLFSIGNWQVRLHKNTGDDAPDFFQTHDGTAFRVTLWGGHVEQFEDGTRKIRIAGMIGVARPECPYRIKRLLSAKTSYELWISANS